MPTAEALVSLTCIEEPGGLLAASSPGHCWNANRAVPVLLPLLGLSDRVRAVRDALLTDLPGDHLGTEEVILAPWTIPGLTG